VVVVNVVVTYLSAEKFTGIPEKRLFTNTFPAVEMVHRSTLTFATAVTVV
jgi:hypothetical protein